MSNSFELDISRFVEKAKGRIDLVVRKVSLDLFKRVIMKSPVDTGRFKGNWQCAIGSVPDGVLAIDDKKGTATVSKMTAAVAGLQAGQIVYLVNNLAYARRLEYGHSQQAPAGVVRITVAEYRGVVEKAAAETKG